MDRKHYKRKTVDVVVIGAGHAGCEAALASARLGMETVMLTISLDSVGDMPCNPNVGGTGKGHLVREVDALGGEMATVIDETFLQSRMLNTSKGPAIHSLRVQADKRRYHETMKNRLEKQAHLQLIEGEAVELIIDGDKVCGVTTLQGAFYEARAVVICTGTFLNGTIFMGDVSYSSGPHGLRPSLYFSDALKKAGIPLKRFKTGTPARVNRRSIDYSQLALQDGDPEIVPFSFLNQDKDFDSTQQMPCYLTYTTDETKRIIDENLYRSPMYSGERHGVGPRYCPSLEDKMVRFADHPQHQIFLEPEGRDTEEIYVQGASTTLPEEVQMAFYRTIKGLENVEIMRSAYGIEYDCIDARALKSSLEARSCKGLFFAGQVNGSSGYEEAAAQGLMAGINAARLLSEKPPLILDRSQAYIGVLIDDLVTKGTNEPYRMMTSRCEYRLSLRQNNADKRLTGIGYAIGLASEERYQRMNEKWERIAKEEERLKNLMVTPTEENNAFLLAQSSSALKTGVTLAELLRRPELTYEELSPIDIDRPDLPKEIRMEVETQIKYEGYIAKQNAQITQFKKLEGRKLLPMDYNLISGLKKEAAEKLNAVQPESIGQASRISGVSPADMNVLLIYLETERRKTKERLHE
ncbi:tRNA uridine-5-carboxymethylaminomethyl(34) synthesis enzyme MnmG [uncultured Murdochiella sp.]|uniref:tRNA uridine-5-carboxymethylaminomethyl(34) synthesis enzyme MnmG n=1 Tax=uncultured Murdochiella sp. TaxID=1586095 RepID=UPI0028046115|nr:tRNA uridine-5-carboxymethylaminomethyl(34) synthesis enzyme MnmG [uncultured Murdochiella sp.]